MSIEVSKIERIFKYMGQMLPDPNPLLPIAQVQSVMAMTYPEIASAGFDVEQKQGKEIITFKKALGTKG